jgi:ubiquitin-like protein Pup
MPKRIQKSKAKAQKDEIDSLEVPVQNPDINKSALVHDMDDILEEIDSVLEENSEEFVKSYVQKGGQ